MRGAAQSQESAEFVLESFERAGRSTGATPHSATYRRSPGFEAAPTACGPDAPRSSCGL